MISGRTVVGKSAGKKTGREEDGRKEIEITCGEEDGRGSSTI
jgi:hypothetical protein